MTEQVAIPRFFLYGEESDSDDSEFVHIETIAARSAERGWKIKPHRHGKLFQLLLISGGAAEIVLDNRKLTVTGESAVIIPAGVVHGFVFLPQTQGYVLSIAEPLIHQSAASKVSGYFNAVLDAPRIIAFSGQTDFNAQIQTYCNLLSLESDTRYAGKRHAVEWLAKMILLSIYREIEYSEAEEVASQKLHSSYYRFQQLVEKHYRQQWGVAKYAEQLQVSVSTLNRLCQKAKGMGAKQIISERLFVEAKRSLLYTQINVDQVAYNLGFEDPAYFSRFFKRKSGLSPKAFRELNPFETEF